ncbi:MAG: B12-binding domain-containing radical SAM protein [Candidatus Pacearchaeota archaeon]|nr:B12-binding domain-containing radical SAM protein [Candidatus Pacearchaeota archaeon]
MTKKILLTTFTRHDEPLGIMYLSSVLKKYGHEVRGVMTEKENIFEAVKDFRPDVIGYSAMTCEKMKTLEINDRLKEKNNFFSIIGGPLATFSQEIIENKNVDALCIGEGEDAFPELLSALENNKDATKIENIHIKLEGKIYRNNVRNLIKNLDDIPFPDREIFKAHKEGGLYNIISSRGCPYSCTYCHNKKFKEMHQGKGKAIRERSIENIIDEMKQISKENTASNFFFQNDHFFLNIKILQEFAKEYKKELNIPFICALRPETLNDEEYVKTLRESNCVTVFTGCEAGNERIRKEVLKRNISNEQILKAAELSKKYGLNIVFQNMIGIPTGTFENDLETLQLNMQAKPFYAWASICSPYPGTEIYNTAKNAGLIPEGYENHLQETYHFRSNLNIPYKNKIDVLHKLFALVVEYPEIFPVLKQEEFYRDIDDKKVGDLKKIFDEFKDYKYKKFDNKDVSLPGVVFDFIEETKRKLKNNFK